MKKEVASNKKGNVGNQVKADQIVVPHRRLHFTTPKVSLPLH